MIFRRRFLDGIRDGRITLAFRRWRRPTVRTGGTLLTAVGQLEIATITPIDLREISQADATAAGYDSLEDLLAELAARPDGTTCRIELGALRPDPRVALRSRADLSDADRARLMEQLRRLDTSAACGSWTRRTLEAIQAHPGLRAADLCRHVGQERVPFKANVRKLKALGLTDSLEVGYRLSARGKAFLTACGSASRGTPG